MKIFSGKYKGRNFYMPFGIRPTQGIARKALFDILGHDLESVELIDLFAGSGAVGLEALSLGAKRVTFVEKDPKCAQVIEENIALLNITPYKEGCGFHELINSDAYATIKALSAQKKKYNIVFVDPPYGRGLAKKALKTLEAYDILHANCVIVIQHEDREILPETQGRFLLFRRRKYGATFISMYKERSKKCEKEKM